MASDEMTSRTVRVGSPEVNVEHEGEESTIRRPKSLSQRLFGQRSEGSNLPESSSTANLIVDSENELARTRAQSRSRLPYHVDHRDEEEHPRQQIMAQRYRYYSRLDPGPESRLRMPDHIVPDRFFILLPFDEILKDGKQSSIITIFSIWNTMMGTSLLSMPWALDQAGLLLGTVLILGMGALAAYTAYRVVQSPDGLALGIDAPEFSHVCGYFWGKKGEWVATIFSLFVLVGGAIAYWVLMSNFLFYTGTVIYDAVETNSTSLIILGNKSLTCDVTCVDKSLTTKHSEEHSTFYLWWSLQGTVPLYLAILAYPLLNFKSPTFFTKFNVFGTISIFYLIIFVTAKSAECGIHLSFDPEVPYYSAPANWHFPALTGTLALSYFIHNAILAILRNQEKPQNNKRDLLIGYALCAGTYTFIALVFYSAFPMKKSCIADNLLNNFGTGDALSAIARVFLLFQMLCVLPLLLYIVRAQLSFAVLGTVYPGLKWVLILNVAIVALCILFAVFLPTVGMILRYTGAISGLVYIFSLPCLVHLKKLQMENRLTVIQIVLHGGIILLGVLNLLGQIVLNFE